MPKTSLSLRHAGAGSSSATVLVPCTCGELVQGILDAEPFLVSCPIDRYSRVTVQLGDEDRLPGVAGSEAAPRRLALDHGEGDSLGARASRPRGSRGRIPLGAGRDAALARVTSTDPGGRGRLAGAPRTDTGEVADAPPAKALRAARATLQLLGRGDTPFHLELHCPLSPSRGFGTSTADVVGAIAATAAAAGAELGPEQIAQLAVGVEPSDGTMFPGLALFDHRHARRWEELGPAPPLLVVVLEFAGAVDTLEFNAHIEMERLRALEPEHRRALEQLRRGLREGRMELIGRAATASARINQQLLPKPQLEAAIELGEMHGALGLCAAHSGTALGLLFRPDAHQAATALLDSAALLPGLEAAWISGMVGGGARSPRDLGGTQSSLF